tara:strand:+ start:7096 stop:7587 length:492 start_codon:yes stop_codon:yes gene_type:complete
MKKNIKIMFPATTDTVITMYTDKDYFLNKYKNLGAQNIALLDESFEEGKFSINIKRCLPADVPVPSFAKKFFSGTMTIVQRDTWDASSKTGRLDIEFKGVPVEASCDMKLVDEGDGSALLMGWNINVKVPLIGGKLEKVLMEDMSKKVELDHLESAKLLNAYM